MNRYEEVFFPREKTVIDLGTVRCECARVLKRHRVMLVPYGPIVTPCTKEMIAAARLIGAVNCVDLVLNAILKFPDFRRRRDLTPLERKLADRRLYTHSIIWGRRSDVLGSRGPKRGVPTPDEVDPRSKKLSDMIHARDVRAFQGLRYYASYTASDGFAP